MPRMEEFGSNIWSAPGVVPHDWPLSGLMGFLPVYALPQAPVTLHRKGEPGLPAAAC